MSKEVHENLGVTTNVICVADINIELNRNADDLSEDGQADVVIIREELRKTIGDAIVKADKKLVELFEKELGPVEDEPTVKTNSKSESEGIMDLLRTITGVIRRDSSPYNDSGNPFKGCSCPSCSLLSDLIENKEVSFQRVMDCDSKLTTFKLRTAVDDGAMTPEEALRVSSKIKGILEKNKR